jgi:peptidoglycan hydrolase-like protein with peptidoglycan-binding domain
MVDGNYGRMTRRAVMAYQTARGLTPVDGIAGDVTTARIDQDLSAKGIEL